MGHDHIGSRSHWVLITSSQDHIGLGSYWVRITLGHDHIGLGSHWVRITSNQDHSGLGSHRDSTQGHTATLIAVIELSTHWNDKHSTFHNCHLLYTTGVCK